MFKIHVYGTGKTNFQILVIKHIGAGSIFDEDKAILILVWRRQAHLHKILVHGIRGRGNRVCENPCVLYTKGVEVTSLQSCYLNSIFKSRYNLGRSCRWDKIPLELRSNSQNLFPYFVFPTKPYAVWYVLQRNGNIPR